MHAEAHAHADRDLYRVDLLDPAHHAEALVAIDQRDIVGRALRWVRDGRRVDRAEPRGDPPFEIGAAAVRTDEPRVEDGTPRRRAPLIGQLALVEIGLIKDRKSTRLNSSH